MLGITLAPVLEGEEEEKENWRACASLTVVTVGETLCSGVKEPKVLLSIEKKKEEIHAYVDSGANAHMFKTKNVFNVCDLGKAPSLQTACDTSNKNPASVGKQDAFYRRREARSEKGQRSCFMRGFS